MEDISSINNLSKILDKESFSYVKAKETDTIEDIIKIVRQATKPSAITIFTRSFGRGTDFELSTKVADNGGCLAIQAYIHEDFSEHVQVRGRVARQGREGTYYFCILKGDLEKINFNAKIYNDNKNSSNRLFEEINKAIEKKFNEKFYKLEMKNKECLDDHKKALELKTNLEDVTKNDIALQTIQKINLFETKRSSCYIFIAIDATGSMSNLFEDTKNCISIVFKRTKEMLVEKKIEKSFCINIGLYRNYSSGTSKIYECSGWCCDVKNIETFLTNQGVSGGQGNEAIEIVFHALNLEANKKDSDIVIQNAILIGDSPPNTREEIISRKTNEFKSSSFAKDIYYETELDEIVKKNIKVNTYYLHNDAKVSFEQIAQKSSGKCDFLDVLNPKSKEVLTDIFSTTVLEELGGSDLVAAYFKKYSTN